MPDLTAVMRQLAQARPIFHSEADFQHALAWALHSAVPTAQVRLEYRALGVERAYVDAWLQTDRGALAIELSQHVAHPPRRYDFVKDLARLERVVAAVPAVRASAILLTNDEAYWTAPRPGQQIDAAFRVHEGRLLHGSLAWTANAGEGTVLGRRESLNLRGAYRARWRDYSVVGGSTGSFRYLMLDVSPPPIGEQVIP